MLTKLGCLLVVSWTEQLILAKLNILFHCDTKKSWLDFSDLNLIFKVTILQIKKSAISSHYLLNKLVDFAQTGIDTLLGGHK